MLTVEEEKILNEMWETNFCSYSEIVGRALRVLQKYREFIGE